MTHSQRKAMIKRKKMQRLCLGLAAVLLVLLVAIAGLTLAGPGAGETTEPVLQDTKPQAQTQPSATTLAPDTQAPVLTGVTPIVLYIGDTPSYSGSVEVTDDLDPAPTICVDDSQVDLYTEGTYPLIYTAGDAAGNTVTEQTTVEVRKKQPVFTGVETVQQQADALLERMLDDSMTKEEQVRTVYRWIRSNCAPTAAAPEEDPLQCAYEMLTQGRGGSYHYYALSKLLLEQLGLQTQQVVRQKKNADEPDHYWLLVSLDEGQTWYHFDAMPRLGRGDDFCLVTDKELDTYSRRHDGSHDRDKTAYPATP